jgi:hypothetical protein
VTGLELCSMILIVWGFVRGTPKACGSHHAQIYGPVRGVATHENSVTMNLYGYGLA